MSLAEINKQLKLGKCPDCLNFGIRYKTEVDFDKLKYNSLYTDEEYWLSKWENPQALLNLPGGIDIIRNIAKNARSPLEEIVEKQNIISEDTIDE
jgi:hypothetical protein